MNRFTENDIKKMCEELYYCNYEFVEEDSPAYELYQKVYSYLKENNIV